MFVLGNLVDAVAIVLDYVLWTYMWIMIIRVILSWVNPDPYNPIVRALYSITDPVLSWLRRRLPLMAGSIDFSPMVVILAIIFLQRFLVASLHGLAFRLR
jgi:YggT family protein